MIKVGMPLLEVEKILQPISTTEIENTLVYWVDENRTMTVSYDRSGVDSDKNGVALNSNASKHKVTSRPDVARSKFPRGLSIQF